MYSALNIFSTASPCYNSLLHTSIDINVHDACVRDRVVLDTYDALLTYTRAFFSVSFEAPL